MLNELSFYWCSRDAWGDSRETTVASPTKGPFCAGDRWRGIPKSSNRRRQHSWPSNADIVAIESKRFQIVETKSLEGTLFHIIERRPNLSRSIIIPLSALHWLRKTLAEAAHLLRLSQPYWRLKDGRGKFCARILSNVNGPFLRLQEISAMIDPSPFVFRMVTGAQAGSFSRFLPSFHSNAS